MDSERLALLGSINSPTSAGRKKCKSRCCTCNEAVMIIATVGTFLSWLFFAIIVFGIFVAIKEGSPVIQKSGEKLIDYGMDKLTPFANDLLTKAENNIQERVNQVLNDFDNQVNKVVETFQNEVSSMENWLNQQTFNVKVAN